MTGEVTPFRDADRLLAEQEADPRYAPVLRDLALLARVRHEPPDGLYEQILGQLDAVDRRRHARGRVAVSLAAAGAIVYAGVRSRVA